MNAESARTSTPHTQRSVSRAPGSAVVVARVSPNQLSGSAGPVRGPRAAVGGDHRRRLVDSTVVISAVQPAPPGVAAPGALLGVAVGLAHRVVDVDVGQLVGAGQQRGRRGQPGE